MTKKARLGRGLDALLTGVEKTVNEGDGALRQLPLDSIRQGRYQPRVRIDEASLRELAASIANQGVIQPIVVRETVAGGFELIAGERRWRASKLAGLTEIPALIRQVSDENALAVALIENIQRQELNPVEEAAGLRRLLDEFGMTHQQVAEQVGRSRAAVSNLLRLLNLVPVVREHLELGRIEMGHARAVLALPREQQQTVAASVIQRRLSVRQTEKLVRGLLSGVRKSKRVPPVKDADLSKLETELSEALAAPVVLEDSGGKGRVIIQYYSLDELDGIIQKFR